MTQPAGFDYTSRHPRIWNFFDQQNLDDFLTAAEIQAIVQDFEADRIETRPNDVRGVAPTFWPGADVGDQFLVILSDDTFEIWDFGTPPVLTQTIEPSGSSGVPPFGNAEISVISPVPEDDREHITVTSFSQSGFGISNYLFHLSDDRNIVGTLAGGSITLEPNVPLDLYLVGPVTAGAGDGDVQHNGTVEGIHFTVTFDGVGLVYEIVESVRHHPGPGDFDTRSYQSVVDNQTIPLTIVENNFGLLFDGLAISTNTETLNEITQKILEWSATNGAIDPVSDRRHNTPVAVLEDSGSDAASYSLVRDDAFENNAVDANRTFRIRVARNLPDITSTLATRFSA